MRARALWPVLAALLLAAGCVTETTLVPLHPTPNTKSGAPVVEDQGVRLTADGKSWHGNPSDLENIVTPVRVLIENQSGRALRIEHEDFVLVGSSRFEYTALAPSEMRQEGYAAVGGSGGGNVSLSVGVGLGFYGYGPYAWGGPFPSTYLWGMWGRPWGPGWYDPWYHSGWYDPSFGPGWYGYGPYGSYAPYYYRPPEPLPTQDMLHQALSEGTLNPGGAVTGFIYFQNVSRREGQVTLQARLVDAHTGEQFATLSIPFGVQTAHY